jgi:phosphatidylglycerol:prolipoprotein diacylglycerol transferase
MLHGYGVSLVSGLAAATPALAIGHAIGRIGCFLVGDDYGKPTDLPWGVAFPEGLPPVHVPVHPTQLYETFLLVPVAWMLIRWRRHGIPDAVVLGLYMVLVGAVRFGIEFVRVNAPVLGPLTFAQLISASLVLTGGALLAGQASRWSRG